MPSLSLTAIEFLGRFPVDYGLIDAHLSADGPFGIFADPEPNPTQTILGGADLVAVDWVGATKMGLDPMISKYMQLAVERFGKPAIDLIGDGAPYHPWLNVPAGLSRLAHQLIDAEPHIGSLLYAAAMGVDETHFKPKGKSPLVRDLRRILRPLRRMLFLSGDESAARRILSWLFTSLGH